MVPAVKKPRHPSDVTVQTVTRETDVINVLRGSKEIVARNALMNSTEIIVVVMLLLIHENIY